MKKIYYLLFIAFIAVVFVFGIKNFFCFNDGSISTKAYAEKIILPDSLPEQLGQNFVVGIDGKVLDDKTKKIFPGYMLIKMELDDPTWLAVRTTPGITGFVGSSNKPTPLSIEEVKNIQKFVSAPAPRFKTKFSVGEAVKITDGPFADFLGSIHEIDEEKGRIKVLVSIFGRETPVELDFLQIQKV